MFPLCLIITILILFVYTKLASKKMESEAACNKRYIKVQPIKQVYTGLTYTRLSKSWRQEAEGGCQGLGAGQLLMHGDRVSVREDEKVRRRTVGMVCTTM